MISVSQLNVLFSVWNQRADKLKANVIYYTLNSSERLTLWQILNTCTACKDFGNLRRKRWTIILFQPVLSIRRPIMTVASCTVWTSEPLNWDQRKMEFQIITCML